MSEYRGLWPEQIPSKENAPKPEFYVGQQVVFNETATNEELMGTVRAINSEKVAINVEGDPSNIVHWVRPENVKSYVDIYTSTNPAPNVFIGPFAAPILKGLIRTWLGQTVYIGSISKENPMNNDYPFDENDSWSWVVKEMKDILERIS